MIENEWYKKYQENFDKEIAKSNSLPDGFQKGKLFKMSVADGYAWYEITKINKLTVWIEWREDLSLDSYQDRILGVGGRIDKEWIEDIILSEDKIRKILPNIPVRGE